MLFVDDEYVPNLEQLRGHGYRIRHLKDIEDISAVAEYQVVLCDIVGVGKAFGSKFGGAHVLGEIRRQYPDKVLLVYTGKTFDPTYNKYMKACDLVLTKDIDTDGWVEHLDQAVALATDPAARWRRLRNALVELDVDAIDLSLLEHEFVKSSLDRQEVSFSHRATGNLSAPAAKILENFVAGMLVSAASAALTGGSGT